MKNEIIQKIGMIELEISQKRTDLDIFLASKKEEFLSSLIGSMNFILAGRPRSDKSTAFAITIDGYEKGSHEKELYRAIAMNHYRLRYESDLLPELRRYEGWKGFVHDADQILKNSPNHTFEWSTQNFTRLDEIEDFLSHLRVKGKKLDTLDWLPIFQKILSLPKGCHFIGGYEAGD